MAYLARTNDVIVKHLHDEIIIYQLDTHTAHRLDTLTSKVWLACDGIRLAPDIAAIVARDYGIVADEELIDLALEELAKAGLLTGDGRPPLEDASRRALFQRLGLASGMALVLPLVTSVIAPQPVMAASAPAPPPPPSHPPPSGPPPPTPPPPRPPPPPPPAP